MVDTCRRVGWSVARGAVAGTCLSSSKKMLVHRVGRSFGGEEERGNVGRISRCVSSVGEPSASLSSLLGRHSGQVVASSCTVADCSLFGRVLSPVPMLDVLFGRLPTNTQFELLVIPPPEKT